MRMPKERHDLHVDPEVGDRRARTRDNREAREDMNAVPCAHVPKELELVGGSTRTDRVGLLGSHPEHPHDPTAS